MTEFKELVETLRAIATVAALLIGGAWTYMLFIQKRQKFPRAQVTHEVFQVDICESHVLYHVAAKVTNTGEVLLPMVSAETRLQQLVPPPQSVADALARGEDPVLQGKWEVQWPLLGIREWTFGEGVAEIEPGESEMLTADFLVPRNVECVEIYTYIPNPKKKHKGIGWSRTTICHCDESYKIYSKEVEVNSAQKPQPPQPQTPPPPRQQPTEHRQMPPKERPPQPPPVERK